MPSSITAALGRLTHALREFTVAQRTIAIIGVAVIVVGGIALGAWFNHSQYSPLFSGLNGKDASAIVDQLDADSIPYQLTDGGSTILVPDADVNAARLKAAAAGLPSLDSGGYALLDAMGVTASDFQQTVTYKRAIEGELAKTIESIDGVRTASVQLAIPQQSVFLSEKANPTASVFIETQGGKSLTTSQVQAITHLTAASVDGLIPDNVSVVDADGTVLSAVGVGATGSTDQQASGYEDKVRTAVQKMLDQVVGVGNATVVVAADMSLQSAQRVEETFTTPTDAPALSEQSSNQTYTGTGSSATGVLGADSIAVPTGTGGDGTYSSDSSTKNNAINKVTETTQIPAGEIRRQTVSVAVNSDVVTGMDAKTLSALVAAAAGVDTDRGDLVNVELVSFTKPDVSQAASALADARAQEQQNSITQIITSAVPFAGAALILVILLSGLRRSRKRKNDVADIGELVQARDAVEQANPQALPAGAPAGAPASFGLPAPAPAPPLAPAGFGAAEYTANQVEAGIDKMRLDIDHLAATSPERMAEHLRTLMDDRSLS
jgi:flagellar M-ring protein FliF